MVERCLMASYAHPPGLFHQELGVCRTSKEYQPLISCPGARKEVIKSGFLDLRPSQLENPETPVSRLVDDKMSVKLASAIMKPMLVDVEGTHPRSVFFSFGIVEHCMRHEKIMRFLKSESTEVEQVVVELSDLMDLQRSAIGMHLRPFAFLDDRLCQHEVAGDEIRPSFVYPGRKSSGENPMVDFVGDLTHSSKITVQPNGQVLFKGISAEIKDILSVASEFYLSRNSVNSRKQSFLVPHFTRLDLSEVGADIDRSSLKLEAAVVAPLKSPEKTKSKPSLKKKHGKKSGKERDLYQKNCFQACESLLSLIVDKRRGKTAFLSLKKSGPELPQLLTQFSAGIAGTGLAVLFSVFYKVSCGRAPLSASKLLNTGFGFALVWLSWAVNKLRDTVIYISKNSSKLGSNEEEMRKMVDKSVNEIFIRAATLMAVAVLRFA